MKTVWKVLLGLFAGGCSIAVIYKVYLHFASRDSSLSLMPFDQFQNTFGNIVKSIPNMTEITPIKLLPKSPMDIMPVNPVMPRIFPEPKFEKNNPIPFIPVTPVPKKKKKSRNPIDDFIPF
jgi:hypothetical protein